MINTLQLEMEIRKNGFSKKEIARAIGLSEQGFLLKLNNKNEFKVSEVSALCKLLNLPDKSIFFDHDSE